MIWIEVAFRGRAAFSANCPALQAVLLDAGITPDEFADNPEMVLEFIHHHWDEVGADYDSDYLEVDMYEVQKGPVTQGAT